MRIESDERRQPWQARCDQDRRRAAHMRPESQAQASDRRCAPPHGLVWAVGGLPHTAYRRTIAVQEPASGKCRLRGMEALVAAAFERRGELGVGPAAFGVEGGRNEGMVPGVDQKSSDVDSPEEVWLELRSNRGC